MPEFNRRRFLQIAGAASLAPTMSALPARAAGASGTAKPAQMLWASLYGQAGNATKFAGVTSKMGLSRAASQGVYAKLAGTQLLAAHSATRLSRVARPAPVIPQIAPVATGVTKGAPISTPTSKTAEKPAELAIKTAKELDTVDVEDETAEAHAQSPQQPDQTP